MSFGVRVFDTVLDSAKIKDTTSRNSADFWSVFCAASGWSFSYERVHSLADLEYFLGRVIKEDIIIFSGHGSKGGWHMTNGEIFLPDSFDPRVLHGKNAGKTVIFSSCLIGASSALCEEYKAFFQAKSVFAYRHLMTDRFCFLNESILLSMMESNRSMTNKGFSEFQENTMFMKNLNQKHVKSHPMIMT